MAHCLGCRRSMDEIMRWSAMGEAERLRIMAELPGRPDPAWLPEGVRSG